MMRSSRIPSPARSQGANSTPRRYKPRVSRSVGSPAQSNTSLKLSAMIQMEKLISSPMPSRKSVLSDTTDIDVPTRKSWWKKLDESSREVMDILNNDGPVQSNKAIEEYIDIDVLSQEKEKKNYMLELPQSSDDESIRSIVIPQRKLFTQKDMEPQKKFKQIIDNRESLAKLNKTQQDDENSLNVGRKNLFNQGTKQRNKPLFPSALLNVSLNKTVANKTKDFAPADINGQVKNLFGNNGGMKRKIMFADFIVSESEDEIPEIQAKVFGFQKKPEQKRRKSLKLHDTHEGHLPSPTSSITDTEMDDWRLLPSSTMVDYQIEHGLRTTPSKKGRLGKLSEAVGSINTEANITANKSKRSNKSIHSNNLSKSKNMGINDFSFDRTDYNKDNAVTGNLNDKSNKSFNVSTATLKNSLHEQSLRKETSKSNRHDKSKSISMHKTITEGPCEIVNDIEGKHLELETSENKGLNKNKSSKTVSRIDQALQSDDDEDFSLVYDNDDEQKCKHRENEIIVCNEASNLIKTPKETGAQRIAQVTEHSASESPADKLQNKSRTESGPHQNEKSKKKDKHDGDSRRQTDDFDDKQSDEVNEISHRNESLNKSDRQQIDSDAEKNTDKQHFCSADEDEGQGTHYNEKSVHQEEESYNEEEIEKEAEQEIQNEDNMYEENVEDKENNIQVREENIQTNTGSTKENEDMLGNVITNSQSKDFHENQTQFHDEDEIKQTAISEFSATPDSTDKNEQNHEQKLLSPEICRKHNKTSGAESFTVKGRKTDVRRTKSNIKNITIRQSLVHVRESIGFSDGSRNSSTDGSGWDSHRTTRATLRQTFGKDFTPRKSLRALVMEKSAKRRTNLTEINAEFSRFPQANSTELPITEYLDIEERDGYQKRNKSNHEVSLKLNHFDMEQKMHKSRDNQQAINSTNANELYKSDPELPLGSKKIRDSNNASKIYIDAQQLNESGDAQEMNDSDHEMSIEIDHSDNVPDINESGNEVLNEGSKNIQKSYDSGDAQEMNESDQEVTCNENADDGQEINESDDAQEMNESDHEVSYDNGADDAQGNEDADDGQEINESDDAQEMKESDQEVSYDNGADDAQGNEDADDGQEINESDDAQEMKESDQEVSYDNGADDGQEMNETDDEQEMNESNQERSNDKRSDDAHDMDDSDHVISRDIDDAEEAHQSSINVSGGEQYENHTDKEESHDVDDEDESQEINDSDDDQEMNESDPKMSHDVDNTDDAQESNECDGEHEHFDSNREASSDNDDSEEEEQDINKSNEVQETDEFEYAQESNEFDKELSRHQDKSKVQKVMADREESTKSRQTTLKMYFQEIENRRLERKKQLIDEIMKTLKPPSRDMLDPFKVPAIPRQRRLKTQPINTKQKPLKSSVISMDMLPAEVLEDMKYKPPKRYKPANASWITKRLYKFLETKLEPKYNYKARVRSERLVEMIYNFVKDIKRHKLAPAEAVDALKREMARLDVVKIHLEFNEFFHEYMPREVRLKVVPDFFNKIPLPKRGVFSDILP